MSYQKSVALLSCCLLFSTLFQNPLLASTLYASFGEHFSEVGNNAEFHPGIPGHNPGMFATLPPDTEGPTITITPPNDVSLTGCYSDFTYSEAAMGKPSFTVYDDCGSATVTESRTDTYQYCATADDTSPEGGLTILREFTFEAVDCFGNTTTESITQTITVTDDESPAFVEALPADVTVDCGSIPDAATLTATDNCDSDVNVAYSETASTTCAGLVRTWVATDDCGNSTTHIQTITVTDTDNPVIAGMPSNIIQTADAGDCGAIVNWTAPTASDNCTLDTFTSTHDSGDSFAVGTTTVTYTATDDCGNSTSASFTVTITDDENPAIAGMPANISQSNDAGNCSAVVNWTAPTTTDNCTTTLTSSHNSGDTFNVGTTTVTYTSTDASGNVTTASFTVTITDDEDPAISGMPGDFDLSNDAGLCGAVVTWTEPTASDNCTLLSFTGSHSSGGTFPVGTTTVTYTATDDSGNTYAETFQIVVSDTELPVISGTPDNISQTIDAGDCGAVVSWTAPTASDNCGVTSFTSTHNSGDTFAAGMTTVTYTATDAAGNQSTSSFTVNITDDENPSISGTPDNIIQTADAGQCGATITYTAPTASDNCSVTSFTSTHNSGDTFAVGTTTVTYTATDAANNQTTSSFTVTITDDEEPAISGTPADITQTADAGQCGATITYTAPTASDNCGVTSFTSTHNSGDTFAVGTTTVTYTAVDAAGNQKTSSFTITVTDDEDPAISAASDASYECDGSGNGTELASWLAANGGATATDNCTNITWTNDYTGDCTTAVGDYRTHTQWQFGGPNNAGGIYMAANFAAVFPAGVNVGCSSGYELVFTSAAAVDHYLPCTGPPSDLVLSHSGPDPTAFSDPSCWNNSLVGHLLSAKMNVGFDANDPAFSAASGSIGDLVATSGVLAGMTANEIIALADEILGDCSNAYAPGVLRTALADFNASFGNGSSMTGKFAPAGCFAGSCEASGSVTVTFTATDDAGNSSSSTATFTIEDTTAPTISAQNFTLTLDENGEATLTTADVDLGTTDVCSSVTLALSQTNFDCSNLGTNTVTFTATDDCGNESTQDLTITVQDTEDPTIGALSDITLNNDAGECGAVATWSDPTTSDNCSVSLSYSHASGSTFDVGNTTVTATATDGAGNTATTTFVVSVSDTEKPTIAGMPSNINTTNDAGICGAQVTWTSPTTADNCGSTISGTHASGTTFAVGTTTVTYTATDDAGNTETASFQITITDSELPSISGTPDDITQTADAGQCGAVVNYTAPTASDNCGIDTFSGDAASGDVFSVGTTTVTYTATDVNGNTTTSSFDVTITDDEDPTISGLPGNIAVNTDWGSCDAVVTWTAPTASDNCGVTSFTSNHSSGNAFPVGITTVTYTATDAAGNQKAESFTVTVSDNENPTIGALSDITLNNDAGQCGAVATWSDPTTSDNCSVSLSYSHASGSTFDVGNTTVTATATDGAGNTATTTFMVSVSDTEKPTIAGMPSNINTTNDAGICGAQVTWTAPTTADNCGSTISGTHASGTTFAVGTTTVTYTATDDAGNTETASFQIIVTDTEAPSISATNQNVSTDAGACTAVVNYSTVTTSDNCTASPTLTYSIADGSTFSIGTTTVTATSTDQFGNASTATFDVIVTDDEAPTITAGADETVECDGAGNNAELLAWLGNNGGATATDNCSGVTWSNDFTTLAYTCGSTSSVNVVFTATDDAGNSSTTQGTFTIEDTTAPSIDTPASNMTVECDGAGNTAAFQAWLDSHGGAAASESCSSLTWTNNYLGDDGEGGTNDFSDGCGATGSITVTFTATDNCGNASETQATFTIEDTTNPTAVGQNATVTLDAAGNGTLSAASIDGGSSDGCGNTTPSASKTAFTCADLGPNTVTLTITDDCGNTATTDVTVTVEDNVAPIITVAAADATYECDGTDYSALFSAWLASNGGATATDACGPLTWTNNSTGLVPGCGNSESEQVTFTVTDGSGNSSTTQATFSVSDTTPPSIASDATNVTTECDGLGNTEELNAWLLANGGAGAATDLCGNVTWSNNFHDLALTCAGSGEIEVVFTATDDCGNAATTIASFIIEDTTAPTLTAGATDRTVECDGSGNTADLSSWLSSNGGATADELCGTITWTNNFVALSDECGATGSATVTFTASDDCGNTVTTSATFTIEDTTSPTALGSDLTVTLDGNGQATITAEDIDNGSSDGCSDVTLAIDVTSFDCDDVGPNNVVLTVTDECMNASAATVTVIVTAVDDAAPTISDVPADITQTADAGECGAVVTYDSPLTADNCDGGTLTSSHPSGSTFPVGTTTVTFTATDASNNQSTATFDITVTDDEAPVIATGGGSGEDYALGPISDSGNSTIQEGWTGGAQAYFQNDGTDDEAVTDAEANSGSNSWFFTDTYGNPGQGSPHAPSLGLPSGTGPGTVFTLEFYFKAEATADGDGSVHKIYQGTYAGDDRTGININIENNTDASGSGLNIFTYSYDVGTGTFPITSIASNLDRNAWHKVNVTYTIDASGDPSLDTVVYSVDDGAGVSANTWMNVWRVANGFTQAYGDRIAWGGSGNTSGFYYDDITYSSDFDGSSQTIGFEASAGAGLQDITLTNDAGICGAQATWTAPSATDNCGVASLTGTHASGTTFAVGTTTVTYTATDDAGNTTTSSFTVTVTDDEDPAIAGTPADINQTADAGMCGAAVTWTAATATDNCAVTSFSADYNSGDTFPVGTTTVTYTAEDAAGNTTTSTFDITVTDDEAPSISDMPSDITQTADAGQCGAVVEWEYFDAVLDANVAPSAADNCGVTSFTSTHDSGDTFAVGTTTVTYTAMDAAGNTTTASFTVTITDDEAPAIASMPADITQTNDAGNCSAAVTWSAPTASDNCGVTSFTSTHNSGDTFAVGTTTVTYTATDAAGNQKSESFTVTITDDEAPSITDTPADISVFTDAGSCDAVVTWTAPTTDDNCAVLSFGSSPANGSTFSTGTTSVTYTSTDIHGNTTTSTFDVTVTDGESPSITTAASDLTVECDGAGNTTELNAWLASYGGSAASDNCGVTSITNDYDAANMSDACGLTGAVLVTFTYADDQGNTATTSATFTIEDTTPPTFDPQGESVTVECDGSGNVDEINAWLEIWNSGITVTDNCGGVMVNKTSTLLTDECGATGQASVTFVATDNCGNVTDTTMTFTIVDTTPPAFLTTAEDLTVECDGAGNTAALQAWLDNHGGATAEDMCGEFTWSNDFIALSDDCGATGGTTVTFTATDECGNSSHTSAQFTIEDTTAPAIASEAVDMTVECDGAGNTAAFAAWLSSNGGAGAASDVCSGVTWSNNSTGLSDDCGATGTETVTFTATDACGNTSSTTATFTIEDTTAPSLDAAATDLTVECDGAGNTAELNAWLAANGGTGMASDVCSAVTWSHDFEGLSDDCGATGTATVTFTATDDCNNATSTTATFTIEDTTNPTIDVEASDLTVECDGAGNPSDLNGWLSSNGGATASDVCSGVTWSNDFAALSDLCGATGDVTVTFTATDDCGLTATTTATFTIEDTTAPVVTGDEVVIIDCSQWPWPTLYEPTIDELLAIVDTAGNPIINLDEACGYTNFPIDYTWMSGGCHYDHQLVYHPIDDCGNVGDTLYQLIQVDDYTDPVFTFVPADTMIACTENVAAYLEMATAEDQCDPSVNMTFEDEIIPTACPEEYTIRRTFYAEDCGYNIATAIQNITVADTAAPGLTLTAPADMAINGCLSSADLSEAAMGSVTWTTSDDCGDVTVTYTTSDANAFSCTGDDAADEGSYVVTRTFMVTATDCAGNSTTESIDQTITITDDTAPTVSLDAPADETVYLDASCYAAPLATPVSGDETGFLVTATDNCDSDVAHTIAVSDDTTYTGVVDGVGSYEILRTYTVTVTDDCGNEASATTSHTISVLDEINPDVTADFPNDTIIYADDVNGYFDPQPISTGVPSVEYTDNCSGEGDDAYGAIGQIVPTGGLIITAVADPNDAASTCRFVEIHNSSDADIDLTGYALQRWTNGNAGPSTSSNVDLSSIGTLAPGTYAHIANNAGFSVCYGFAPAIVAGSGGPADSNGDDQIAIIDGAANIIDIYGVPGEDGSDTCHDFEDGIALRAGSNTDPNGGTWNEAGWIMYSDFSNASGCSNHNSNQPQNAADIAPLVSNWAGAAPPAPPSDFNTANYSFTDVTTSYTASACYTFERTWTITVTDNNGNATTVTDVQTIQVADTSAPDIAALETTTAACDLFGIDLSAGDLSTAIAGTSFEEPTSGGQYVDTGDASVDHALENNAGQSDVNYTSTGGELGFSSYYISTGSNGLTDGDFVGVTNFTGTVGAFTDGGQGFQFQDTDGIMELVFDNVDVSMGGVTLTLDAFVQSTGWETSSPEDIIRIWVVADGGEVDILNTSGQDIDDLGIEGAWITYSLDLDGYDDVQLHISLASNSGSEGLFIDNVLFAQGTSPLATLQANGYVSFSDNVELATTAAAITYDAAPCEGAYDIVYTATDSCGNMTTSNQRIVLIDTVAPGLFVTEPADTVLFADANCDADYIDGVPYPSASASDNCDADAAITSYHVDSPKQYACLPSTGAFTVLRTYTFTATDNCGNTTTQQVNRLVTVVDTISPTFNAVAPADLTVNIDPFCGANTSTTIGGMPTVTDAADNCDSSVDIETTYSDSAPVYTCANADGAAEGSYTFVRTFTVTGTDDCGNATSVTLTQNITALDISAPTILALPAMAADNYTLDGDCVADLTPITMPTPMATDACDSEVGFTMTYTDSAPVYSCSNADGEAEGSFSFTRTWTVTATDDCGNSTAQQTSQSIVVSDNLAPTLTASWPADYAADLEANCMVDLSPAAAGAATATSEDACDSDVSVAVSYTDHDTTLFAVNIDAAAQGGFSFIRTWTATGTDDCGNATTETHDQTITANDVTAPTVSIETLPTYTVEGCYGEVDLSPAVTGMPSASAEDGCDSEVDLEVTYATDDLVFNEVVGDYSLVFDTISGTQDGVMGMTTVRIYIETANEDDFISAVAGDEINPTGIRTTTSFYQNPLGGATANNFNPLLLNADPLLAYDSFVTIGIDQQPAAGEEATTTVGGWPASFEGGNDLLINDFFGGSWFTTNPNTAAVAGPDHRVLLGQFTTDGQMSGQLFVQVFPNGLGSQEMRLSFTFGDCAEDDDTPEGSYTFTRRWTATAADDANNIDSAVTYQHIMVLDTEAPQLTNTCGIDNGETINYDCPGIGVMDFDPVPVACDVQAIDNCDSEVNVTLFSESSGYIPTDAIRNYCAPATPEAHSGNQTCDDRAPEALRLFNFPGADDSFIIDTDAESLVEVMADGSLSISMAVENADGTGGFILSATYGAGQDWATWQAGGSNYKKDCAEIYPGQAVWEDWYYFLMTSGSLEGTGLYAGSSFTLSHQPANGYYGLQMGLGANNKNTNYGGSAWFFWQGNLVYSGTNMGPMASSGDLFMDLDCCLEWQVDYYYTAFDDCGNPTGFAYSEAMGSDLGTGDAGVSGGHTTGPVDISSVGGIKEPIRITGLAPNPTTNHSQLTFVVNDNMRLRVDLYTANGLLIQELYDGNAVSGVQYAMDINVDELAAGMYQVRISSSNYIAVKKLLVAD